MNRTDRLFALLLELRGTGAGGWIQAERLARTFGVSVRTIYRDMLALNESGVPVVSVAGQGYRLLEGYFLPPLHLSVPEAMMLAFGADAVGAAFDAEYAQAAQLARKKLLAALPAEKSAEVAALREYLRVIPPSEGADAEKLRLLRGAVLGRRAVTFAYHKPHAAPTQRQAYPLALVYLNGTWMLGAFDTGRGERRAFRLSRIESLRVQPAQFVRDPAWKGGPEPATERRDLRVRLLFAPQQKRLVLERPNFFQTSATDTPAGFEVTLQVRDWREIWSWVLSWGAAVRVLEPPELREHLRAEAQRMLLT